MEVVVMLQSTKELEEEALVLSHKRLKKALLEHQALSDNNRLKALEEVLLVLHQVYKLYNSSHQVVLNNNHKVSK